MAALLVVVAFVFAVTGCAGQAVPITFNQDQPHRRHDPCIDGSGLRPAEGVCLPMQQCSAAMEAYTTVGATLPTTCGFEGVTRIVCCAVGKLKRVTLSTDVPVISLTSPPVLDFECGQRPPFEPRNHSVPDIDPLPVNDIFTVNTTDPGDYDGFSISAGEAIGGFTPRSNSWPWVALIGWSMPDGSTLWRCGGALINRRWVVTAAHCFDRGAPQSVRLGEQNYSSSDGPFRQDFKISQYLRYPEYSLRAAYHDIALVELDRDIELKPQVAPVCLPWGDESLTSLPGWSATLTGWGATEFSGELSPILQEVSLSIFSSRACNSSYSSLPSFEIDFPRGITTDDFVCAGDSSGGKDACSGDSGSPITYHRFDANYILAGVVSKGYGCGLADFPGLYTPIHKGEYLNWIKTTAFKIPSLLRVRALAPNRVKRMFHPT